MCSVPKRLRWRRYRLDSPPEFEVSPGASLDLAMLCGVNLVWS
jgi:hypothetical protein